MLNLSKLIGLKNSGGKQTAQCPACAEAGNDKKKNHLAVFADGRYGCVVNPGPEGNEHRKRIHELVGEAEAGHKPPTMDGVVKVWPAKNRVLIADLSKILSNKDFDEVAIEREAIRGDNGDAEFNVEEFK